MREEKTAREEEERERRTKERREGGGGEGYKTRLGKVEYGCPRFSNI